jgi:hypothetical protein
MESKALKVETRYQQHLRVGWSLAQVGDGDIN